jgi:hypothetical protein
MFHSKGIDSVKKLAYEIQNGFVQGLSALTVRKKSTVASNHLINRT